MVFQVRAFWDAEAQVWVAQSSDIPGLVTEAPGLDSLKTKLDVLIPELLAANGQPPVTGGSVAIELVAEFGEPVAPGRG